MKRKKSKLFLIATTFVLLTFQNCVIIKLNDFHKTKQHSEKLESMNNLKHQDFETTLLKFPNVPIINESPNTLHLTVINYNQKLIADVIMLKDINDSLNFKIEIRNFDKTLVSTIPVSIPTYLFDKLSFEKNTSSRYYLKSSSLNDSNLSCLVNNILVQSDKSGLLYSYSGELINTFSSEVTFWAQTDPVATKIVFGAIIITSNFMEKINWKIDLCDYRIKESIRMKQCRTQPIVNISYFTKPLAAIFYGSLWKDFYLDCNVVDVKCSPK